MRGQPPCGPNPTARGKSLALRPPCIHLPSDLMATIPPALPFTGNDAADALVSTDALALLIGFALDQQVTVQKAFSGPWDLRSRIGHLDAGRIAAMDPAELDRVFR